MMKTSEKCDTKNHEKCMTGIKGEGKRKNIYTENEEKVVHELRE